MNNDERSALLLEVIPRLMRLIRTEMRQLGKSKLTVPQFRILNQLSRRQMSNQELAEWMGVSAPTMSKMVDGLVKRKLASKKTEHSDRRQVALECTSEGTKLSEQIKSSVQKQFAAKISKLSEKDLKTIESSLQIMKANLL